VAALAISLDKEQRAIVKQIQREARFIKDRTARRKFKRAAVQTGLVESNLRNLPGGDADSQGWRQERRSLYPNPRNVKASVRRFREEFMQHYDPGERASDVAGQVQRPAAQYLGRYQERAADAKQILREVRGGGPAPPTMEFGNGGKQFGSVTKTKTDIDSLLMDTLLEGRKRKGSLFDSVTAKITSGEYDTTKTKALRSVMRQPSKTGPVGDERKEMRRRGRYEIAELFWQGPDGINIKHGKKVPQGFVDGHTNHVHVAAGPKGIISLGRLAQRMGLTVRENPAFDPVDPVHAERSYHYSDRAIDVSGPPELMAKFAHRVANMRK